MLRECNRKGSQSHKRKPISHFHLFLLAEKYGNENSSYRELSQLVLLGYRGFLRFSEIVNIKRSEISFQDQQVSIIN